MIDNSQNVITDPPTPMIGFALRPTTAMVPVVGSQEMRPAMLMWIPTVGVDAKRPKLVAVRSPPRARSHTSPVAPSACVCVWGGGWVVIKSVLEFPKNGYGYVAAHTTSPMVPHTSSVVPVVTVTHPHAILMVNLCYYAQTVKRAHRRPPLKRAF